MTIVYLSKSKKSGKKFTVRIVTIVGKNEKIKTIHFGASGMSDYTKHKDKERLNRYITRHKKNENWGKSGINTAGFWSRWLLWNKPSIEASKRNISSRFGVKFGNGVRKSLRKPRKKSNKSSRKVRKSSRKSRKVRKSGKRSRRSRR